MYNNVIPGNLRIWDRFFVRNIPKMRKWYIKYLEKEGIKYKFEDGIIIIDYEDILYEVLFITHGSYAECKITYPCDDSGYESLDITDKTFIADKVNTDMDNHCKVLAFNDSIRVVISFYFTSKVMMMDLFLTHFKEIVSTIEFVAEVYVDRAEERKPSRNRIGFNVDYNANSGDKDTDLNVVATS